jgi:undecaprenyl-phosphate 4-deoxy-4-formamido-L-arabinose transferase
MYSLFVAHHEERTSMSSNISLSVVIPVYNEEANLEELIQRLLCTLDGLRRSCEVIFVDDGSSDKSPAIIERAAAASAGRIIGVFLNRNYGQHAAVMAGFAQSRGDVVVTLDADLQNPPEEIPKLVAKADEGYDVVGSVRVPRADSWFRRFASYLTNQTIRAATGVHMHDYGCMLRAYRRPIVNAMLQCHERSTFIPVLANTFARRTAEVEVSHAERRRGASKYNLWKLINLQFDLLTSMTTFPIRLLSLLGTVISALGIGFGLLLFILRLIHGPEWAAEGVFTLFAILFVFVGTQFIGLGLLGEYLGRIYYDVRARPRYFIERIVGRTEEKKA